MRKLEPRPGSHGYRRRESRVAFLPVARVSCTQKRPYALQSTQSQLNGLGAAAPTPARDCSQQPEGPRRAWDLGARGRGPWQLPVQLSVASHMYGFSQTVLQLCLLCFQAASQQLKLN